MPLLPALRPLVELALGATGDGSLVVLEPELGPAIVVVVCALATAGAGESTTESAVVPVPIRPAASVT